MISAIVGLISGVVGWLASVLPDSPFAGILEGAQGLQTGLAWLNWLVPIGQFGAVFAAYLTVLLIWTAIDAALNNSIKGVFDVAAGD